MSTCWYCSSELPDGSQYCHSCGHSQTDRSSSPLFGVVDPVTGIWNSKFINAHGPPHFAIVLPETNEQGATLAADKIRRGIAAHDFATGGNWQRITVSCGAATIGVMPAGDVEAGLMNRREYTGNLVREAYQALEAGRSAGTNRTSVG